MLGTQCVRAFETGRFACNSIINGILTWVVYWILDRVPTVFFDHFFLTRTNAPIMR